jgi:hypothetical protein
LIGTDGYNQRLSERRADAVRTALVARGASDHDLVMRGFGKRKPIRNFAAAVRIPSWRASAEYAIGAKRRRCPMQAVRLSPQTARHTVSVNAMTERN